MLYMVLDVHDFIKVPLFFKKINFFIEIVFFSYIIV